MSSGLQKLVQSKLSEANEWPLLSAFLLLTGALTFTKYALKTIAFLSQTFILPGHNLEKFGAKKGAWAVVTGASDGIGREFSIQLAQAGYNILLVARNNKMLGDVAAAISEKCGSSVETRIELVDFSKNDEALYANLKTVLAGMDVGVLVNCVGRSYDMPTYLAEADEKLMDDIITINVAGTVRVTRAVLPGMVARKRGLILNLGSFAGSIPSPMLATYSGTKAFVSTFSDALAEEVKGHGIVVEHLNTYFVVSKMSNIKRPSLFVPTPKAYVRSALSKIGSPCGAAFTNRPATSTPYWGHALLDWAIHVVGWKQLFISHTHGLHTDIRRRALRKLAREAKKE